MAPEQGNDAVVRRVSTPVERLLTGLWQQREELGLIADELLDLFRDYGVNLPRDPTAGGGSTPSRG